MRHISNYKCHLKRDMPPRRVMSRRKMWTQVPGPALEAMWCRGKSALFCEKPGFWFHFSPDSHDSERFRKIFVCLNALICKMKHPNQISYELPFISIILHPRIEVHLYEPINSTFSLLYLESTYPTINFPQ